MYLVAPEHKNNRFQKFIFYLNNNKIRYRPLAWARNSRRKIIDEPLVKKEVCNQLVTRIPRNSMHVVYGLKDALWNQAGE